MIGFALSSPPGKPKVAFYSEVSPGKGKINFGSQQINISELRQRSCSESIQPIKVHSRDEAMAKVQDGEALAAVIIPADMPSADPEPRHQRGRQPDRRADPQHQGSAPAPIRQPGDPTRLSQVRAGRLQAGARVAVSDLQQVLSGGTDQLPRGRTSTCSACAIALDHPGHDRLAAGELAVANGARQVVDFAESRDPGARLRHARCSARSATL